MGHRLEMKESGEESWRGREYDYVQKSDGK
jgi:hypothetical protein